MLRDPEGWAGKSYVEYTVAEDELDDIEWSDDDDFEYNQYYGMSLDSTRKRKPAISKKAAWEEIFQLSAEAITRFRRQGQSPALSE